MNKVTKSENKLDREEMCEMSMNGKHILHRVADRTTYFVYACDSCCKTETVDRYPSKEHHEA